MFGDDLTGGSGADTLSGGGGGDRLDGGAGFDTVSYASSAGVTASLIAPGTNTGEAAGDVYVSIENLTGSDFADRLTGNAFANVLTGGGGADVLDGARGADTLIGGTGNDLYVVRTGLEIIIENAGEGVDTVKSVVSYTLGDNVDRLVLAGTADINGYGNGDANRIVGNAGENILDGRGGADVLIGGLGNDTFVFGQGLGTGVDKIMDFAAGDKVRIDGGYFTAFSNGEFDASMFADITHAKATAGAHLLYNQDKGALYYDADGLGGAKPIAIAVFDNHYALTAADFDVIGARP